MTGYGMSSTEQEKKRQTNYQKSKSENTNIETISLENQIFDGEMPLNPVHTNSFIPGAFSEIKRLYNYYIRK